MSFAMYSSIKSFNLVVQEGKLVKGDIDIAGKDLYSILPKHKAWDDIIFRISALSHNIKQGTVKAEYESSSMCQLRGKFNFNFCLTTGKVFDILIFDEPGMESLYIVNNKEVSHDELISILK